MASANTTSPAKVVHRFRTGNINLSVFADHKATVQRSYVHGGETKYAHSLHVEDVEKAIEALQEFKRWAGLQELAAGSKDKSAA